MGGVALVRNYLAGRKNIESRTETEAAWRLGFTANNFTCY